jgi:phage-related protein
MTTFTPSVDPSASGTSKDTVAQVKRAEFGDGYSQRARDGLNSVKRTVTLSWDALTTAEADALESFFETQAGADLFTYTLPQESTAYKWTCSHWRRAPIDYGVVTFSADLIQEFDL